jgi:hypothetical protein
MDVRHTPTFVTIAELGSVSKAALRLPLRNLRCHDRSAIWKRNLVYNFLTAWGVDWF